MGECERCKARIPADLRADYAGARRAMDMMMPGIEGETPIWCEACLTEGVYPSTPVEGKAGGAVNKHTGQCPHCRRRGVHRGGCPSQLPVIR